MNALTTISWHMIDKMCLNYLNLVIMGRNFCDRFINKDDFKINQITMYLSNDQQYALNSLLDGHTLVNDISNDQDYWIEIVYYHNERRYRVIYNKWDQIKFPPYTLEEIKSDNVADTFRIEIIYADYNDEDITALIKEYAGPKGNFYHDKEFHVTLERIIGSGAIKKYNDKQLLITDNNANDHSFTESDIIRFRKI